MSIIVPAEEVERLINVMISSFYRQTKRQIIKENSAFSFIQARENTFVGMQLRAIVSDRYLKLRVYVQGFDYKEEIRPYRLEVIKDQTFGTLEDEVWVAYAVLPKTMYSAISGVRNQIPQYFGNSVEIPVDRQSLLSGAEIGVSGHLFYATSEVYPSRHDDRVQSSPSVLDAKTSAFLTSQLYPLYGNEILAPEAVITPISPFKYFTSQAYATRGLEQMQSGLELGDSSTYRGAQELEQQTVYSDLIHFLLGINPYSGDGYVWTRSGGEQYEAMTIFSMIDGFNKLQTYFIVDQSWYRSDGTDYERMTITVSDMTSFTNLQTYFPVDNSYRRSDTEDQDRMSITSAMTGFTKT